jgi:hypothetical protein
MSTALDGQSLFGEQQLEIELGSVSRASMERVLPGLDGVLSVDMGGRARKIKQANQRNIGLYGWQYAHVGN